MKIDTCCKILRRGHPNHSATRCREWCPFCVGYRHSKEMLVVDKEDEFKIKSQMQNLYLKYSE